MSLPFEDSLTRRIVAACDRASGLSQPEIRDVTGGETRVVRSRLPQMVSAGMLFCGGIRCLYRYFAKQADRDAWERDSAAELDEIRARRSMSEQEKQRIRDRRRNGRRKAQRAAAPKPPRPKMSAEERRKRKAEYERRRYAEKRMEKGLIVGAAQKAATTPRKATKEQPGRGRGIVIAPSEFMPIDKANRPQTKQQANHEPIITSSTKVTICQSGRDMRFHVDPSIAGRGEITKDWQARREMER